MEEEHEKMMSLRARRKKPSVGISCCFTGATQHHHRRASFDASSNYSSSHPTPWRSTCGWFKSRTNDLPEMKGKYRSFISRMARHRRHASADFSYDPLSYALNFEDDASSAAADDFPALSFSARLPVSPPRRTTTTRNATPFDHNLPRSRMPGSPEVMGWKKEEASGSDELRRGFEALALSMKASSPLGGQRRSDKLCTELSSPRVAAVAGVRKSLEAEEVTAPAVGISSNREILVQLC